MTKYGRSPWIDRFPSSRVPAYPKYRGRTSADVAVIGGGLTGCLTAYAFAAAGIDVVLLEEDRVGRGATAMSDGRIAGDPGVGFADVERVMGLRDARHGWQSWRRASLDFVALLRRLNVKCDLVPRGTLQIASTADAALALRKEQKSRRGASMEASVVNGAAVSSEVAISALAALRSKDGATIDPYRAALGVASAAVARGARIFENSPVVRTTFNRKIAFVHTRAGSITVRRVVVATGTPTALFKSLRRHFWFKSSYLVLTDPVPAKVRRNLGKRVMVVRDSAIPPHVDPLGGR